MVQQSTVRRGAGGPPPGVVTAPEDETVLTSRQAFDSWWEERRRSGRFRVTRIPFAELESWSFEPGTGNLRHDSGRFFTVEAVELPDGTGPPASQPIICQPEIGILGILVKEFDGEPHCLMQAKMEPGNVNTLQLSPTVQATRSNYSQVHRGGRTRYLEYFAGHRRGDVLVDTLQSEQGAWFWRKRNRNVVVRTDEVVPAHEDFRWLPLWLMHELLRVDNLVNMDARTVLSCLPAPSGPAAAPRHTEREIRSWFIEEKTRCDWQPRLIPLAAVRGWARTAHELGDAEGRQFRIVAVRVEGAGSREVASWSQPLLRPAGPGLAVFVTRRIRGVPHLLTRARPEVGLLDLVEIGPTVQLRPGQHPDALEPFVREVATGAAGRVRYDVLHSEEGGRFHHALTRYRIVEVGEDFPLDVPRSYCWITPGQLVRLLRHGHYLNIEARSLLACVRSMR
ncbi:MAG TPA: NDP-hexose 2,3-dehydratase family protein [Pilimelia sp.]|nr:NDP-hexose 2,3-dehydratase family protein [Pilimelia sp.]